MKTNLHYANVYYVNKANMRFCVIFTLFFSGKNLPPKCWQTGDQMNIQNEHMLHNDQDDIRRFTNIEIN